LDLSSRGAVGCSHVNIKIAIKLYEKGKMDRVQRVFIMEGKIVTGKEMFEGTASTLRIYLMNGLR
jgi:hypothetical protein